MVIEDVSRARIGHNNPPPDEDDLPPAGKRIVNRERAERVLIAARLISTLYRTPKNRILEKRKGGEDGRALRRFLIFFAVGEGCPVWECAKIFDLNRKQIGQEHGAYLDMLASNPDLEEDVENMTSMLDYALRVKCDRFIRVSLSEIQAEAAVRKAIKTAREAVDVIAKPEPKPKPVLTEVERIQAAANAKRKAEALQQQIKIAKAVIEKSKGPKATKEQRKDAERAEKALNAMLKKLEQA